MSFQTNLFQSPTTLGVIKLIMIIHQYQMLGGCSERQSDGNIGRPSRAHRRKPVRLGVPFHPGPAYERWVRALQETETQTVRGDPIGTHYMGILIPQEFYRYFRGVK